MTSSMMDGNHPDFCIVNQIVEAVKFETMHWRTAHIGKADAVDFRMVRETFAPQH